MKAKTKNRSLGCGRMSLRRCFRFSPPLCFALLAASATFSVDAGATPPAGVTAEPLAFGTLPEPIRTKFKKASDAVANGFGEGVDVSQLVMIKFTVQPGGYFGWHRHGGPVWVAFTSGTLTLYDSDDTSCTGQEYGPGTVFLETGDHVHNARNEGVVDAVLYVTFMLPAGADILDSTPADPGVCPF